MSWKIACALVLAIGAVAGTAFAGTVPDPGLVEVPAGPFIAGSDDAERETAYLLDEAAYGHSVTRRQRWYANERQRQTVELDAFAITRDLITNRDYAAFVAATGYPAPFVDRETWDSYGLIHPYERAEAYNWVDGAPPPGRLDHPVVLVAHTDAVAFAKWLTCETGYHWRLPAELEWEKAARGVDGRRFPWGDSFDPALLNSHDQGPFSTMSVGSFASGTSIFGLRDPAGQVFEWTADEARAGRYVVKGGSWDDKGCGICRPAARHTRPEALKHILVGFRLVRE